MKSLTIFTAPKPLEGHLAVIQRNAITSWMKLRPACEVLLCGDEPGIGDAARSSGAKHIPDIDCSEFGTPRLDSVFQQAAEAANNPVLCYVNADIILMDDFVDAVKQVPFERFVMVGQRRDVDIDECLDFEDPEWERRLREKTAQTGSLHPVTGIDYFVFPKDTVLERLPPFIVGRPGWDNWFIYRARKLGIPVIDATEALFAIHQNHGYAHVPQRRGPTWEGPEADWNRKLAGNVEHVFTILDASHLLTARGVRPAWTRRHIRSRLQAVPDLHPAAKPLWRFQRWMRRTLHIG